MEWDFRPSPRGLRLRISEWGEGPILLVLHGYLEQGAAWQSVATHLPERRVIAPDHRGHGLSEHLGAGGWYHFFDYLPDVVGLIEHLGRPADLLGHSMGGTIACLVAAHAPEYVRRLVLVDGLGPPEPRNSETRPRRFVDCVLAPPTHRPMASVEEAAERMRRYNPRLPAGEALRLAGRTTRPAEPDEGPDGSLVWTWDPLHRGPNPSAFDPDAFAQVLRRIEAPTAVIWGAQSPFIASERMERTRHLRNCVDERAIEGAGHLVHLDAPEALAMALRDILD